MLKRILPVVLASLGLAAGGLNAADEVASVRSVPYVWRNVAMGGGGFVDGIVFHPTAKDLMYARTDVGGAYRWEAKDRQWVSLNDWLSPTQNNYTGIESIGLDPANPDCVYLAAGTYSRSPAAILRSDDRGKTFQVIEVPFRMGGNEDGRSNGERLAVDPNDGAVLFFGSRREGLWRSADRGTTWQRVESFTDTGTVIPPAVPANASAASPRRNVAAGIVSVVFDPASGKRGAPTQVIYAAVSSAGPSLYRSADAGTSWQPVPGQPVGLLPSHLIRAADGRLYLTYGSVPGPNGVGDGALWKYDPKAGEWANISPEKPTEGQRLGWGYGAVSVDARLPASVVVTTIDRWGPKDEVFRSTDGGVTWKGILTANGRLDHSFAPYTASRTPHWLGTVAVDPIDSNRILFGTGYGIWCSTDATVADTGGRVTWVFLNRGLEETVPLALISPPAGAHLISGVGDIDGFRHDDLDVSPAAGTFAGPPRFASTRDLAFAGGKPETLVRIGNSGSRDVEVSHGAISADGGKTWQAFAGDPPGGGSGQGNLALSADGRIIVWALPRGATYVTTDRGATWRQCQGLANGARVIADPVNVALLCAGRGDQQAAGQHGRRRGFRRHGGGVAGDARIRRSQRRCVRCQ